jgi:hypothetical protein
MVSTIFAGLPELVAISGKMLDTGYSESHK